jgi:type I restriction enzyme R subunit
MNGFPDTQTAKTFALPAFRFLIVANTYQTGFDQPLRHTMCVDKKLGGVNEAAAIKAAFDPYYETTLLSEATGPNLLYEMQARLAEFPVYTEAEVHRFAAIYFDGTSGQDRLYAALAEPRARALGLAPDERDRFRGQLGEYNRLYAFLAQLLPFMDIDLEKLHVFARSLRRLLPAEREALPREVQQAIDMVSYRLQETASGRIVLDRRPGVLDPQGSRGVAPDPVEEQETLSRIIAELNDRFGLDLGPEHRVTLNQMMDRLDSDPALDAAARVNTRENVRRTFDQKVEQVIQEIVDTNFDLYKRITDDRVFGDVLKDELFEAYVRLRDRSRA